MALVDDVLNTINASLLANLPWLDNAYGKIQRMRRKDAQGKDINFPGVYVGGSTNDYVNVLPDTKLGNYSYFEVSDPTGYENVNRNINVSFNFKLSIWFDWRDIYPADYKARSIEEVKAQILNVLMATQYTRTIEVYQVYEDANSIFQNFTNQGYISAYDHHIIEGQFLMKPYGGLAISGRVHSMPACAQDIVAPTIPAYLYGMIPANYSTSETIDPYWKWFGSNIYCKTFLLSAGYTTLTGVSNGWLVVKNEYRQKSAIDNSWSFAQPFIEEGVSEYKAFLADDFTSAYLTIWYIK